MTVYITRCPVCQQAFKTNESVLAQKNGMVRCGFCQSTFNAYEHLYTPLNQSDLNNMLQVQAERQAQIQRKGLDAMAALAGQLKGFESMGEADSSLIGVRAEPKLNPAPVKQEVINAGPSIQVIEHRPVNETVGEGADEALGQDSDEEDDEYEEESPRRRLTWLWGLIALIAFIGIVCQLMAMNRSSILAKLPQAEPIFGGLCSVFSCEQASENSPVQAEQTSPATGAVALLQQELVALPENHYAIKVVLKNNTTVDQPYPLLTVVLKGEKEDVLTRRQLRPAEYLDNPQKKLAAQAQDEVTFAFDLTDGKAESLSVEVEPIL